MKIIEIIMPKNAQDKSLSAKHTQHIDVLQKRMDSYIDKICDPNTPNKGREFLKAKLRNDLTELATTFKKLAEESVPVSDQKYEVYDRKTGERVGGPYTTASRARNVRDKKDNDYGGYRYGVRPAKPLSEAVHKLPLANEDYDLLEEVMKTPIPAAVASIYIQDIIDDDELNDQLKELSNSKPAYDVRPIIAEWFKRVMPDQLYRFNDSGWTTQQKMGQLSPVHGFEPENYHGANNTITGNAYGRRK